MKIYPKLTNEYLEKGLDIGLSENDMYSLVGVWYDAGIKESIVLELLDNTFKIAEKLKDKFETIQ
jgi:hypothetical protein